MMWWKPKWLRPDRTDERTPVCETVLPLPDSRALIGALAALEKLHLHTPSPATFTVRMEPGAWSTLRIRGFDGVDLDGLTGCLKTILTRFSPGGCLTLSYQRGCTGVLAQPEGGVLQVAADSVEPRSTDERHMKFLSVGNSSTLLCAFPTNELTEGPSPGFQCKG